MKFDKFFRASSYGMIACGVMALAVAGGTGAWALLFFAAALVASWWLEGTRWQLTERKALVVILLALPLFYLDWTLQAGLLDISAAGHPRVSALAHFTLLLSAIKLFQVKGDRDWIFLYLISFFQVLLAAGLTVSPVFLLLLALYMFAAVTTVVCFELKKAARIAPASESRLLVANDTKFHWRKGGKRRGGGERALRRLPVTALGLLFLIFALALPIFLISPRAGDSALAMAGGTATNGYIGFSESVTLGDIGRLQESNHLVMRVRLEGAAPRGRHLLWRGVALDDFDGHKWRRESDESPRLVPSERNLFRVGTTEDLRRLTTQTFFVEPIDTPVLFAAPRAVAVQGALPYVRHDDGDGLSSRPHLEERISYKVYSDTIEPEEALLRTDRGRFSLAPTVNMRQPVENYLRLPEELDTRVASLAALVIKESGASNIYDAARAVEAHLGRNQYGGQYSYSLSQRGSGSDPLADFLFNVRAGHCEYYSTAMAVMLRTQGFPTRIVNGFQTGEYNAAADAYTVRQRDAHSWVEVYFPETDVWVTFDPTPVAGRPSGADENGLRAQLRKYSEALELLWIQYVVAYDKQEQRTLAQSLREKLGSYRVGIESTAGALKSALASWWSDAAGEGMGRRLLVLTTPTFIIILVALGLIATAVWFKRRFNFARGDRATVGGRANAPDVAFYQRMLAALEMRGLKRASDQTPLEFASIVGTSEAVIITEAYHRVRYGAQNISASEVLEIENCLRRLEGKSRDE